MKLTALQAYNIEKALTKLDYAGARSQYQAATGCDAATAERDVADILATLKKQKPWYFKNSGTEASLAEPAVQTKQPAASIKAGLLVFLLVDMLIFAGIAYYFVFRDTSERGALSAIKRDAAPESRGIGEPVQGWPKQIQVPASVSERSYTAQLGLNETFSSLYKQKIASRAYVRRKSSSASRTYDDSAKERKIKSARSELAAARQAPVGIIPITMRLAY